MELLWCDVIQVVCFSNHSIDINSVLMVEEVLEEMGRVGGPGGEGKDKVERGR